MCQEVLGKFYLYTNVCLLYTCYAMALANVQNILLLQPTQPTQTADRHFLGRLLFSPCPSLRFMASLCWIFMHRDCMGVRTRQERQYM